MARKLTTRGFSAIFAVLMFVGIGLGVILPDLYAQAPAGGGPPAPPPLTAETMRGKTAGQLYKNLKVLNDVPAAGLHNAMEYINVALGVGCAHCHTIGKFDNDDKKEKNVARDMIRMTMALNATVFDDKLEVTCFTCHRGIAKAAPSPAVDGEKSAAAPALAEIFPPLAIQKITDLNSDMSPSKVPPTVVSGSPPAFMAAAGSSAPLPAAADLFSKYTQALGGTAAINEVMSLVEKGTVDMLVPPPPGPPGTPAAPAAIGTVPAEIDRKLPGKVFVSIRFPGIAPNLEGFDGTVSWVGAREEAGSEADLRREFAEFPAALKFMENHSRVKVDAVEKIGDRDAYRVVGTRSDGSAMDRLYFDAQTGLLVRSYTTFQTILGSYPEETNYSDYRVVSGIEVPFIMAIVSPAGNRTYKWMQIDANVPVEDSRFTKPLPPTPPPRPAAN